MGQISFARGVPSPDLLPVDDLREAAARGASSRTPPARCRTRRAGYAPLREWIGARHGVRRRPRAAGQRLAAGGRVPGGAAVRRLAAAARWSRIRPTTARS